MPKRIKYPSQEDAQFLIDWYEAVNVSLGGVSDRIRKAFNRAEDIRIEHHVRVFGDKSPWTINRKRFKPVLSWDKDKAKELGIT